MFGKIDYYLNQRVHKMSGETTNNTVVIGNTLEDFKKIVRKAIFMHEGEAAYFEKIPDIYWADIFSVNFSGNLSYAKRVLLSQFRDIDQVDAPAVNREKNKIHHLGLASDTVIDCIERGIPILMITDFDNDGSLAQSVLQEFLTIDTKAAEVFKVEYAQQMNGNTARGFTVDMVDAMVEYYGYAVTDEFLVMTADNGINSRDEQEKILNKYPNAKLIVTDHHDPEDQMVIQEGPRAIIVNPRFKPAPYFEKYSISGAATLGVLLKRILIERFGADLLEYGQNLDNMTKLSKVANLLDVVFTAPIDKPEKDYVIHRFLELQPLLNISNSMSNIVRGGINGKTKQAIVKKCPDLDISLLEAEAEKVAAQNEIAKVLLLVNEFYVNHMKEEKQRRAADIEYKIEEVDFNAVFMSMLTASSVQELSDRSDLNKNFIEQLRPYILRYAADDGKDVFIDKIHNKMIQVFEQLKGVEKSLSEVLRPSGIITRQRLANSVIVYADPDITSTFNRKFLNKVYNDENPGFTVTLDSVKANKVSGSLRSLFDVSDIFKNKQDLEKELNISLEMPGHQRAAGFIITSTDPERFPITEETLGKINEYIDRSVGILNSKVRAEKKPLLLTDLSVVALLDRINKVVRGNVSTFKHISPVLKLSENTVWTDSYSTEQFSLQDVIDKKKYGYISINTNFHGDTVIVPVELVRRVVENNFEDFLNISYMDNGVFMADRIIKSTKDLVVIDMQDNQHKTKSVMDVFEKDFSKNPMVSLTRDQIKDNPFFKYNPFGEKDFDLFEQVVLRVMDDNDVDVLAVFDVEANGFSNSKLMNFGAMNYTVNPESGTKVSHKAFKRSVFKTSNSREVWLNAEQIGQLSTLTLSRKNKLLDKEQGRVITQATKKGQIKYYLMPEAPEVFLKNTDYVRNSKNFDANTVLINQEIQAEIVAYLVKDQDFKVPQEMINLTGITQELLDAYGIPSAEVDKGLTEYYKDKKVLFGAHNIPYDARVLRVNTPNFYQTISQSLVYDSALFSREEKLAYDNIYVAHFEGIPGLPKNIFFYNNLYSDFNVSQFIEEGKNGYFPDRTNRYLLELEDETYYLVDKEKNEKVNLKTNYKVLMEKMVASPIPNMSIKYSVEKLSEQWMVRALLLDSISEPIQCVDLKNAAYASLRPFAKELVFFQEQYYFGASPYSNYMNFKMEFPILNNGLIEKETLEQFFEEFLTINKSMQQRFSDAWMYKMVLSIKDPVQAELNKELIDLVHFQTQLPHEKIKHIFDEAITFKKKYQVTKVLQHEGHMNGPWEYDDKGDVAFEDKLTFSLMGQKMSNQYAILNGVEDASRLFTHYQKKAQLAFRTAEMFAEEVAEDSYSYRQALQYDRDNMSFVVKGIQKREADMANGSREVIKFKLNNDICPQDSAVYAIVKDGASITREQVESDSRALSFILLQEQIKSSIVKLKDLKIKDQIVIILEQNIPKIVELKEDLEKRYRHIEFNRHDYQLKKLLDTCMDILETGEFSKSKMDVTDVPAGDILFLKDIIIEQSDLRVKQGINDPLPIKLILDLLDEMAGRNVKTSLEDALDQPNVSFSSTSNGGTGDLNDYVEKNFLYSVPILRRDPLKIMLEKHQGLNFINAWLSEKIDISAKPKRSSIMAV